MVCLYLLFIRLLFPTLFQKLILLIIVTVSYNVALFKITEFVATAIEVPEEASESLQTFQCFFYRLSYTIRHPDLLAQDLCEHGVID